MPCIEPEEAVKLILRGKAPADLSTDVLDLSFQVVKKPIQLPPRLRCFSLRLCEQPLETLPDDLSVEFKLDLTGCAQLRSLPAALKSSTLILTNCVRFQALPDQLNTNFLQLDGCASLEHWPESAQVTRGWVRARGCSSLRQLPERLGSVTSLDLRDCRRIDRIPAGVRVRSWIDIGGTQVTSLPEPLSGIGLRWRGVTINAQIAFFPETLNGSDILTERNAELRRVMIERVGFEKFLREVDARVRDSDTDRGGERKLYHVPLEGDESIVVVSMRCPSTGRHYLVRVPPAIQTCRAAIAWTAGFDNPEDYVPIEET